MEKVLVVLGVVLALVGVIFIYDARPITRKIFGFGDQNEASMGLKIVGFLMSMAGAFFVYFNF